MHDKRIGSPLNQLGLAYSCVPVIPYLLLPLVSQRDQNTIDQPVTITSNLFSNHSAVNREQNIFYLFIH